MTASAGKRRLMAREDPGDRSLADLIKQLSEQTQTLVRDEIRLATLELREKGKQAGLGAGLFGASGLIALFGAGTLIASVVLVLATFLDAWLAALIVALVLFATAALLGLTGRREIQQAGPLVPREAIQSTKQDVQAVKQRVAHRADADPAPATRPVRR